MTYLPGLGAVDLSAIGKQMGQQAMISAADAAVQVPDIRTNRARAAALAHLGYETLDTFEQYRPLLFALSVAGSIASWYALWKRKRVPEAATLYTTSGLASSLMAWLTRPDFLRSAVPAQVPASNPQSSEYMKRSLAWTDARVARLTAEEPGWEARTLARLWADLGQGTMDPAVNVLLTKNTH